jgi:hypothetical protein
MVLKLRTLMIALAVGVSGQVIAQRSKVKGLFKYEVANLSCPVRIKTERNGAWKSFDASSKLQVGTVVVGKPSKKSEDIVVFKTKLVPQAVLAARKSCLFKAGESTEVSLVETRKWLVGLSTLTWQEGLTFKLSGATTLKTKMRANNLGVCLGGQRLVVKQDQEYGWGGCFVYAKAEVANAALPDFGDGEYVAKNIDVYGIQGAASWYWRPEGGAVAVGGQIPLMIRLGRYPIPDSTGDSLNIGPRVWFLLGLMLETRLERGRYYFSQKIGFYNIPRSLAWGIEGGYTF